MRPIKSLTFFGFLFILITSIPAFAAGRVDISRGPTISPNPVTIGENFTIRFTLKEHGGSPKYFDYIQAWIQSSNGNDLYMAKEWPGELFFSGTTKNYSASTYLDPNRGRQTGTYRVVIRGKVPGDPTGPFNFNILGQRNNWTTFSAIDKSVASNTFCKGNRSQQIALGKLVLKGNYRGVSFGYLCRYGYSKKQLIAKDLPTYHAGVDYRAKPGTPVYAAVSGMLRDSKTDTWGQGIYIEPDISFQGQQGHIFYLHIRPITSKYNTHVNKGELIGFIANKGAGHVHIEMRANNYSGQYAVGRRSCGDGTCDTETEVANLTVDPGILAGRPNNTPKPNQESYAEKANIVFNFIESKYRSLFPSHQPTRTYITGNHKTYYRHYPSKNAYLWAWKDKHLWYKLSSRSHWVKGETIDAWIKYIRTQK